jgi:hypothetical protein
MINLNVNFHNGEEHIKDMIREIDEIIDNLTIQQAYWNKKKEEFKKELKNGRDENE